MYICIYALKDVLQQINLINGVRQEFSFAHPSTKCRLTQKYCTSFNRGGVHNFPCTIMGRLENA